MKTKTIKMCSIMILSVGLSSMYAQQGSMSSGGNASGAGGSVSYSVGQVVYTTAVGANGSMAQGVQQPYEISVTTGLENTNGINLQFNTYPNPTSDFLILTIENYTTEKLSYQLYDIKGKRIENKQIISNTTTLSIVELPAATYILKVMDLNQEIKTFKIIKN